MSEFGVSYLDFSPIPTDAQLYESAQRILEKSSTSRAADDLGIFAMIACKTLEDDREVPQAVRDRFDAADGYAQYECEVEASNGRATVGFTRERENPQALGSLSDMIVYEFDFQGTAEALPGIKVTSLNNSGEDAEDPGEPVDFVPTDDERLQIGWFLDDWQRAGLATA